MAHAGALPASQQFLKAAWPPWVATGHGHMDRLPGMDAGCWPWAARAALAYGTFEL